MEVRKLSCNDFWLKILYLFPLLVMSYLDLKKLRVSNNVSAPSLIIGVTTFLFEFSINPLAIFFKLLLLCVLIFYAFLKVIGGGDLKAYIYLLLVMDAKLLILIIPISLLLGGLALELRENRIPLIPIITLVSIGLIIIYR